MKIEFSG